ncbi:MAG: HAD hydrolase-like protein [Chloroflexota bacterium]
MSYTPSRLILFDIDYTLLFTHGAGREATQHAMEEIFGTSSRIHSHEFGGKTDWQTLVELLEEHGYDERRIGEVMHRYEQAAARHMERVIDNYPVAPCTGALELVEYLRRLPGVMLGVVTGNVSTVAPIKLRAAGFDPAWFPVGAFGNEAHNRNDLPPLALARAREYYGRPIEPRDVIVVGDTVADVVCAKANGAVAVAVASGTVSRETLAATNPDYLLDDLTEFVDTVPLPNVTPRKV